MLETKVSPDKKKEIKAEIEFSPILEEKYREEMQAFFDFAATMSGDVHPKSTSPDGTGEVKKTLNSGSQIFYSLQDRRFPELFAVFSRTTLFDDICKKYFSNISKEKVESVIRMCLEGNEKDVASILAEINLSAEDFLKLLIEVQKEWGVTVSPKFTNLPPDASLTNSDLLNNLLFVRNSGILGLLSM